MSREKSPLVSVIVPVYNVEKYLRECVDSIVSQTYQNIEIILVDDGSPDKSGKMCDEFAKDDSRIKVVHKKNEGLNFARKTGFEHSTGEFIAFIDSDDVVDENYIRYLIKPLLGTENDMSLCGYVHFTETPEFNEDDLTVESRNTDEIVRAYFRGIQLDGKFFLQTAHMKLFRRRLIEQVDWEASNYRVNEDELMSMFLYKNITTDTIPFIENKLYYYRKNPDSIMSGVKKEYKNSFNEKNVGRLDFLDAVCDKRLEMFGDEYEDEILFWYSVHYLVYVYEQYKKSRYELTDEEKNQFNSRLVDIRKAHTRYGLWGLYVPLFDYISRSDDIGVFYGYMEKNPLISVIVPVYNVEKYLRECVDSIVSQTYQNIEIILVDDGAKDGSGVICDEYAERDERVRVFHQKNGGVSSARNFGIGKSVGDYVVFVDGDDFLAPNAIEQLMKRAIVDDELVDIVIGDKVPYHSQGYEGNVQETVVPKSVVFDANSSDADVICGLMTDVNNVFYKLFRRNLLVDNDIKFPEDLRIAEDLVFVTKLFFTAKRLYFTGEGLYYYRTDFDNKYSAMGKVSEEKAFDFGTALKLIEQFLKKEKFLKNLQAKEALQKVVVIHSVYALDVSEKDAVVHRKVFDYLRKDLFPYFGINENSEPEKEKNRLITAGRYEEYIMLRLQDTKKYLFNRLDALGYVESEVKDRGRTISELRGEIEYLKSVRGIMLALPKKARGALRGLTNKNS